MSHASDRDPRIKSLVINYHDSDDSSEGWEWDLNPGAILGESFAFANMLHLVELPLFSPSDVFKVRHNLVESDHSYSHSHL